jgi:hypothetical protein
MRKVSFQIAWYALLSVNIILIMSACMKPVDVQPFLEDEKVQEIIEANRAKVKIDPDSDDFANLKAEDKQILGLVSGKYYRVEEYDEGMAFKRNLYIKADGSWGGFREIGRLKANVISNLNNNYTYKIKSALPFSDAVHNYFVFGDTVTQKADVVDGAVTIKGEKDYYLDLSPEIKADKDYEVMQIPVTGTWDFSRTSAPYGSTGMISGINEILYIPKFDNTKKIGIYQYRTAVTSNGIDLQNMSIIALSDIDVNTSVDYVFLEYNSGSITNFTVLSVEKLESLETDVSISGITLSYTSENSPQITPPTGPFYQTSQVTFTVINAAAYSSYKWYIDGEEQPGKTTSSFTFDIRTNYDHNMLGTCIITVEATTTDNMTYSTEIRIQITS